MSESESDKPVPLLTTAERTRLRSTVDTAALERFLAAIPDEVRPGVQRAVVLHFSQHVTMAEIREFLIAAGNDDVADAMRNAARSAPADVAPPEATVPPEDRIFSMEPPQSPRLRALWDAIEPQPPHAG
jgi:hypothetical protein